MQELQTALDKKGLELLKHEKLTTELRYLLPAHKRNFESATVGGLGLGPTSSGSVNESEKLDGQKAMTEFMQITVQSLKERLEQKDQTIKNYQDVLAAKEKELQQRSAELQEEIAKLRYNFFFRGSFKFLRIEFERIFKIFSGKNWKSAPKSGWKRSEPNREIYWMN